MKTPKQNVFKFKSFSDRISEIDIRKQALYHVAHPNEEHDEAETQFHSTYDKWFGLNLTEEFSLFLKETGRIVTLPQLIHKKDFVIDHLEKCLKNSTSLSLQPLLEFVVALAKDLREEFYPYFKRFLVVLIDLLNTKDPEQIEWTLICLAYLFKSLKPFLKKEIAMVFKLVLPLLSDSNKVEITNFAAECFSFVVRDIRDKQGFIANILKTVNTNCDGITGCGNLFYEIVRGVNGRFHNCAEQFLTEIFECFRNDNLEPYYNLLKEILTETIDNINVNITRENYVAFWNSILKCIENLEGEYSKSHNIKTENTIDLLLQFVDQIIVYKNGINVTKPSELVNRILSLLKLNISENLSLTISKICTGILLSECIQIEQYESTTFCRQILSIRYNTVFESFVLSMVNYTHFDFQILPEFLKYFNSHYSDSCLKLLCTIITKKSPPCWNGIDLDKWKIYPINHKFNNKCVQQLEYNIQDFKPDLGNFIASVICCTHIESIDKNTMKLGLHTNLNEVQELIKTCANVNDCRRYIFVISIIVEALVHMGETLDTEKLIDLVLPYADDFRYSQALRIIDLLVTCSTNNENGLFEKLHGKLSNNLSSPYHEYRQLTSHILMKFNGLYESIFKIETTKSDIHNYRHQIQILTTFACDTEYYKVSLEGTVMALDPLKYLFGILYVNFKLLWEPATKLISNYSEYVNAQQFWPVLESSFTFCNKAITQNVTDDINEIISLGTNHEIIEEYFDSAYEIRDKPDFINFRCLLLNCIAECGQLSETKNRDIIPIFLKFFDDEYRATNKELQLTQNISNVESETKLDRNEFRKSNAVQRTLINYLKIFSKMGNIKGIYKQDVLHDIIFELLTHANFEVQKLALDCMMKYKVKSILAYKNNLCNIIDEKTFKNEVVALKIDENVQEREKLVAVLMKILLSKLGMKMHSNKNTGNLRKSLIFRCLSSNCTEQEILTFVKLNLQKYEFFLNYDNDDYSSDTIDLTCYLNPKKIQSILTFVDLVRTNFAGIMNENFIKFMIHVICIVGKKLQLALNRQEEVKPTIITSLKNLRNVVMSSLISIFDQFDEYNWTDEQFDVIFKIFIWPNLSKLPSDSIHTPTQLLKLFIEFGKSDSHKELLFKQYKHDQTFTPTYFIIKLLQNPSTSRSVCRAIMEIIENLLETHSDLLTPFISDILNKIETNLSSKSGRSQLLQSDLNVLSKLTKLDIDPKFCDKLLSLILPTMIKQLKLRTVKEDSVMQTLNTISNLLDKVDSPMKYYRTIIPLFLQLNDQPTRSVLCQIINGISKEDKHIAEIVNGLNAQSKRWIDQPDHEVRLATFKTIGEWTKSGDLSMDACLIIIYHCFYFLKHDNDLAIRDSSAYHLKMVVLATVDKYNEINKQEIEYLIGTIILNLVRNSITDKNSVVRTEGILLLGELVREFPNCHQVLTDLHPLTNKLDREVDFFDNITHLQSHRQGRALIKFCEISIACETPPSSRTLTQFILPIASSYVCKEAYFKKHGVIDASIQTIGTVCRLLPWYQYELVLRYYLNKLKSNSEYQKQIVRIVMGILDSFHFDLSKATGIPIVIKEQREKPKLGNNKIANAEEDDNVEGDLEKILDQMEDVVQENSDVKVENNKFEIIDKLNSAAAKKLISTLTNNIIPMLNNSISKLSVHEASHKLNKGHKTRDIEDEHTLKVPIALAIVKLLQKLPHGALDTNLPGIFLKVGTFLKSRLKSIRMLSRDILRKIMVSVGPTYLGMLLNHLSSLLTRGYQCHVFAITLHNVLDALKDDFKPADIDKNLGTILHICMDDIFGATAAEKEVEKLAANTPEAKPSNKSYMILNIVAQNISDVSLLDLMIPFKEQLRKSQSKKITNKIYEAFKKITAGLIANKYITIESLIIFVYGVTSASIPDLQILNSNSGKLSSKLNKNLNKSDTFIIPEAPKMPNSNVHAVVKTNNQANAHILIEFGLEMLHIILKQRLNDGADYTQYINPFISIIDSSLSSFNVGVATYALKCLTTIWNSKELAYPDLITCVDSMVLKIFQILHKYATVGMSTNSENYHLVKNVFKAVVALLRHVDYYTITEDQLKILLLHAEQDLHSSDKSHSFAFTLLKAVLAKKLVTSEIHDIMNKVAEISILSESNSIREEARSIFLSYFMNYSLGKKVETFIKFYVNQLSVDLITGRQSAIYCLMAIIKKLPLHLLKQQAGFLFLSVGTRMVNDDETDCRSFAANTIEILLKRLEKNDLDKLFEIVVLLLNDDKPIHCEMGAQLCIRFVSAEENKFIPRIKQIYPLLLTKLTANNSEEAGKFVKQIIKVDDDSSEVNEQQQNQIDHQVIQIQNLIIKIIENCAEILDNHKLNEFIDELAYSSQRLLNDEHAWIRVNAIKILEFILANTDYEYIQNMITNTDHAKSNKYRRFLYEDPVADIKSLVLDNIAQLIPDATSEDTANAVMKNLLYIGNFLKNTVTDETEKQTGENENLRINLIWLIRKVRFAINSEVAKAPLQITIRIAAFNWIMGMLSILDEIKIKNLAQTLLGPLVREMSEEDTTVNPKLRQLAVKIGNKIKKTLGEDDYNMIRSRIQTKLIMARAKRKKIIAQEKVNDVELAMKRKIGVKNRKIKAQKRKNEMFKGKPISKKKRRLEID